MRRFRHIIGEPTTDHAARYHNFESISLQPRVCELSVPRRQPSPFAAAGYARDPTNADALVEKVADRSGLRFVNRRASKWPTGLGAGLFDFRIAGAFSSSG